MKPVMLYALSTCPFCKMAKRFFENQNIPYNFVDVDLLPEEEKEKTVAEVQRISGRRAFPVIVIGEEVIVGYDELRIREALEK
ncbi:glutaredoxin domain-containing protein [Candidatus Caldatribacterium saccharofermentans]|uniref:NrdH-redoxin n=1 Tax=Candidatus Caldatribacterium saccharofermentans TaxID=1454753 RepID=A0A7V4WJI9_9BACT